MTPAETREWLHRAIFDNGQTVTPMDLRDSTDWALQHGAIRHRTGRFFSVVGVIGKNIAQPMIVQREIGTLGFVFRTGTVGPEVLVQAKIEPGNVGGAQLGPSSRQLPAISTESMAERPRPVWPCSKSRMRTSSVIRCRANRAVVFLASPIGIGIAE